MLRVIISPAKKMRAGSESFAVQGAPALSAQAAALLDALSALDAQALQALWKVSDRLLPACLETLAELTRAGIPRHDDDLADPDFSARISPAILAYVGIQYQSMAPGVLDEGALAWLQEHLRILSGLYGCLRPFDAVLPYRLEMGAHLAVGNHRDLYGFWGSAIAREVCADGVNAPGDRIPHVEAGRQAEGTPRGEAGRQDEEISRVEARWRDERMPHGGTERQAEKTAHGESEGQREKTSRSAPIDHVINLASVEYARAVLPHLPEAIRCTTCIFGEELRAGKPVQRSTASKTARGSLVRWMAERRLEDPAELTRFDVGYRFAAELSCENTLVFMRS